MSHPRQAIRLAAVSILEAAGIVAPGQVFSNRRLSVAADALPIISVAGLPETSVPRDLTTKVLRRDLELNIELIASNDGLVLVDDVLDGYCELLENALSADPTLLGSCIDSHLTGTEFLQDVIGEFPIGRLIFKYTAIYFA